MTQPQAVGIGGGQLFAEQVETECLGKPQQDVWMCCAELVMAGMQTTLVVTQPRPGGSWKNWIRLLPKREAKQCPCHVDGAGDDYAAVPADGTGRGVRTLSHALPHRRCGRTNSVVAGANILLCDYVHLHKGTGWLLRILTAHTATALSFKLSHMYNTPGLC